jgi:hypothetical protein
MIVDGQAEFVGSICEWGDEHDRKICGRSKGKIEARIVPDSLKIAITDLPAIDQATVYLAVTEDNLTSNVSGARIQAKSFRTHRSCMS